MMRHWIVVGIALLLGPLTALAEAPPAQLQSCVACHGDKGVSSNPEWPNLAGQNANYLAAQIIAFRDGRRSNPMMDTLVADLTDADAGALAQWYAGQDNAVSASGDAKLVAAGENLSSYCKACHGMSGTPVANEWPVLAGQQAAYLHKQLSAFKNGSRTSSFMQAAISQLGEPEFVALAAFYSQLKP